MKYRLLPTTFAAIVGIGMAQSIYTHFTTTPEQRAEEVRYQAAVDASKQYGDNLRDSLEFKITSTQRTRCRQQIHRAMHDPSSFRWEGSMSDMRRSGVLVYSGTNAFGGRVRETYLCG